jgi:hypothetical protein
MSHDQHKHDQQPVDKQGSHDKREERKEQHASHAQPPVDQADGQAGTGSGKPNPQRGQQPMPPTQTATPGQGARGGDPVGQKKSAEHGAEPERGVAMHKPDERNRKTA